MSLLKKMQIAPCLILLNILFSFSFLNAQVTYQNNQREQIDVNDDHLDIGNFHVPAGNNRVVVVCVGSHGVNSFVSNITFNGQSFTQATFLTRQSERSEIWYLELSGTSIINENLVISFFQQFSEAQAVATSYTGVNPSSPIGVTDKVGGFGNFSMLPFSSTAGNLIVDCVQHESWDPLTFGANQTVIGNTALNFSQTGMSFESATGNFVEMSWSAPASAHFAYCAIELKQAVALPVELKYFRALPNPQSVTLDWATATEINNDYFTIERSVNGLDFEPIAKVKGAGSSFEELAYSFVDERLPEGNTQLYYRLRQIDFDGTSKIEKVVSVDLQHFHSLVNLVTIYPNPTSDILNIRFNEKMEKGKIEIFNELGQKVLERDLNHPSQNTISVRDFPSGVYFLNLKTDGKSLIKRIIVSE